MVESVVELGLSFFSFKLEVTADAPCVMGVCAFRTRTSCCLLFELPCEPARGLENFFVTRLVAIFFFPQASLMLGFSFSCLPRGSESPWGRWVGGGKGFRFRRGFSRADA